MPVTIVAGWHGAGKTSLLRHLVDHCVATGIDGSELVVIQGGFSDDEVGEARVMATEEEVVELEPGCPDCALRVDLARALPLVTLRRNPPRHLFIELSGDADVVTVTQTLIGDADLRRSTRIDSILTVVDAEDIVGRLATGRSFLPTATSSDQISVADNVIVNRIERLSPHACDAVTWGIRRLNPHAPMAIGRVPPARQLIDVGAFDPGQVEHRLGALGPPAAAQGTTTWLDVDGALDPAGLYGWIDELHHDHRRDLLRMHGVFSVAGEDHRWILSGARAVVEFDIGSAWASDRRSSRLVLTGHDLDLAGLRASLREHVCA